MKKKTPKELARWLDCNFGGIHMAIARRKKDGSHYIHRELTMRDFLEYQQILTILNKIGDDPRTRGVLAREKQISVTG